MTSTLIALAGVSASGKTYLARQLAAQVLHHWGFAPRVIALDGYYRDFSYLSFSQRARINFDHPDSFDSTGLLEHLQGLKCGEAVCLRQYDYIEHRPLLDSQPSTPTPLIVLEGILALHWPAIRELIDISFYVDTPIAECAERRLRRDTDERGRSEGAVTRQWREQVLPMYERFVLPQRQLAHSIVSNSDTVTPVYQQVCGSLQCRH